MATAQIRVNGTPGSNTDVALGDTVYFSNQDNWEVTTWEWALVSQPYGAPYAILQNADGPTPFMVLNKEGSYLVKLVVNKGLEDETTDQIVVAVRELETDARIPAVGETTEVSTTDGWTVSAINEILKFVARLQVDGLIPAVAGEALSIGDIVYVGGIVPQGQPVRGVAKCFKALASNAQHMNGLLGIVLDNIPTHNMGVNEGDRIQVRVTGFMPGNATLEEGGNVGDKVYISDTGGFSLTSGTFSRQIGTVAAALGGTAYKVYFTGYPSGGASGPAGGVLGYPGSTYPNPLGLSALLVDSSSVIPMVPVEGQNLIWFKPDAAETGTSVTVSGGDATGPYLSGTAMLRGGMRSDAPYNEYSRVEVSGAFSNETGFIRLWTGDAGLHNSGSVNIKTGDGKETGHIHMYTGTVSDEVGYSGDFKILTGFAAGTSGGILISTGRATNHPDVGVSGTIRIETSVGRLNTGGIILRTGGIYSLPNSTPGNISLEPGNNDGLRGKLIFGDNTFPVDMLTQGSMLYASIPEDPSRGSLVELPIGAEGNVLSVTGGLPVWKGFFDALPAGDDGQFLITSGPVPQWAYPAAGGILGYPNSTYPSPTGLSGVDVGGSSTIPMVPAAGYNEVILQPDVAGVGTNVTISGGVCDTNWGAGHVTLRGGTMTNVPGNAETFIRVSGSYSGPTGGIRLETGGSVENATGAILGITGIGKGETGSVIFETGSSIEGRSGSVSITTGNAKGNSGGILLMTGFSNNPGITNVSGSIELKTRSGHYASGNILLEAGGTYDIPDSIPGNISLQPGNNAGTRGRLVFGDNTFPVDALTQGSILYAPVPVDPSKGSLVELLVGTDGQFLTASGGLPVWSDPSFGPNAITPGSEGQFLVTSSGTTQWADFTAPAGGILGYPGSTYPNPNGLSAVEINGDSVIPLVPVAGYEHIYLRADPSPAPILEATSIVVRAGDTDGSGSGTGGYLRLYSGAPTDTPFEYFRSYMGIEGSTPDRSGGAGISTGTVYGKQSGNIFIHTGEGQTSGGIDLSTGSATQQTTSDSTSGTVRVWTGQAKHYSGSFEVETGWALEENGEAGAVSLIGGSGGYRGGQVFIKGGDVTSEINPGIPGDIRLIPGHNNVNPVQQGKLWLGDNSFPVVSAAAGSLLYTSSVNTFAELPVGGEHYILSVSGGMPIWTDISSITSPAGGVLTGSYPNPSGLQAIPDPDIEGWGYVPINWTNGTVVLSPAAVSDTSVGSFWITGANNTLVDGKGGDIRLRPGEGNNNGPPGNVFIGGGNNTVPGGGRVWVEAMRELWLDAHSEIQMPRHGDVPVRLGNGYQPVTIAAPIRLGNMLMVPDSNGDAYAGTIGQVLTSRGGLTTPTWTNLSDITSPAGGILGYPGSTYPNPTGLSAVNVEGESVIPLVPLESHELIVIRPDEAPSASKGTEILLQAGSHPTQTGRVQIWAGLGAPNQTLPARLTLEGYDPSSTLTSQGVTLATGLCEGLASGYLNVYTQGGDIKRSGDILIRTGSTLAADANTDPTDTTGSIEIVTSMSVGGNTGDITIGTGASTNHTSGSINLLAGDSSTQGGLVRIQAGSGGIGGNIEIVAGYGDDGVGGPGTGGDGGTLFLRGGTSLSNGDGGDVEIRSGGNNQTGYAGDVRIISADNFIDHSHAGDISLESSKDIHVNFEGTLYVGESIQSAAVKRPTVFLGEVQLDNALKAGGGTAGLEGEVLTSHGPTQTPTWKPNLGGLAQYATEVSSVDQTITTSALNIEFDTTLANNVIQVDPAQPTQIAVRYDGVYAVTLSPQLVYTGTGTETVSIWLKVSGAYYPNSAIQVVLTPSSSRARPTIEFVLPLSKTDYIEWACRATEGTHLTLQHTNASLDGFVPLSPSVVATVRRVGSITVDDQGI